MHSPRSYAASPSVGNKRRILHLVYLPHTESPQKQFPPITSLLFVILLPILDKRKGTISNFEHTRLCRCVIKMYPNYSLAKATWRTANVFAISALIRPLPVTRKRGFCSKTRHNNNRLVDKGSPFPPRQRSKLQDRNHHTKGNTE